MDTTGIDPVLASVLSRYYGKTFGGQENWKTIQSARFVGLLHLPQGSVRFVAYKKKPNLCKVAISTENGALVVLAYDGEDAWQLNTAQADPVPIDMDAAEAQNFIRDASMGGHLLYPGEKGKKLQILGTADIDGSACYLIEQILPSGQRVVSAIDVVSMDEKRQTTVNAVNGLEEENHFSDFRTLEQVRFPFASIMRSNGEVVHRVEMLEIRLNLGLMPWMFKRPSGAFFPDDSEGSAFPNDEFFERLKSTTPLKDSFGPETPNPGLFQNIEVDEVKSILEDIGKPVL